MYFSSRANFTQTKAHYKTNTAVVQGLKVHNNLFDIFYWTQSKCLLSVWSDGFPLGGVRGNPYEGH